jgi:hypothetical protein
MPLALLGSNVIRFTLSFEKDSAYADPQTVSLQLKKPDGTLLSPAPTLVKQETGVWRYDFDTAGQPPGTWKYRAEGDGQLDAATEGTFEITTSSF